MNASTGRGPAAVRAHRWTTRALDRGVNIVLAVHDGLWLGAADREMLHAVDGTTTAGRPPSPTPATTAAG